MIQPFIDNQKLIIDFVSNGLWQDIAGFDNHAQALGFGSVEQGIVAGVVYHNYDNVHHSIELSCHSESNKWFTKSNLNVMFYYPFNQLNLRLIRFIIEEKNYKLQRLFEIINANMIKIPDLFKDGENAIIATLKRSDWFNSKLCNRVLYGEAKSTETC